MSNRDFAKHNGLIAFIAILLVLILVGGIIGGLYYFNRCLFGHDYDENGVCTRCGEKKLDKVEKEPDQEDPNEEKKEANVNGGGMATVLPGNGIMLMAGKMAPTAGVPTSVVENTWTLTASVNEHADDKYINWSVRWKDAQSAWAKGKTVTEYLTVTPTTAGALTATVKVLKDFGAQIEVVATSRDNPEKSAVCLFDYVQKITGITFNMPNISSESTSFTYEFQTTAYTVAAEMKLELAGNKKLSLSDIFQDVDEFAAGKLDFSDMARGHFFYNDVSLSLSDKTISFIKPSRTQGYLDIQGLAGYFYSYNGDERDFDSSQIIAGFREYVNDESPDGYFDIVFTATYNDKTYSSGSKTIDVEFDGGSIHVPVTDVTLDQSHIYA